MNLMVLFVRDLDESVTFVGIYDDRRWSSQGQFFDHCAITLDQTPVSAGAIRGDDLVDFSVRQVFLKFGNEDMFSLCDVDGCGRSRMPLRSRISGLDRSRGRRCPN